MLTRLWFFPLILAVTTLAISPNIFSEPIVVRVNSSQFPPYSYEKAHTNTSITDDMLTVINAFQSKYHFTLVHGPVMRRFYSFEKGRYDLSFFDHLHWGWAQYAVQATRVYLRGGEKYVALAKAGRGQEYFNDFKNKVLGGFLGYHYGVANFNSDPKVLKKDFNMELSTTHEGNLLKVIEQRIDVAILTDAFLSRYLIEHPQYQDQLLVSDVWDQEYSFSIVVRDGASPSVEELNELLHQMERARALYPVWEKYGIPPAAYEVN